MIYFSASANIEYAEAHRDGGNIESLPVTVLDAGFMPSWRMHMHADSELLLDLHMALKYPRYKQ